MGSNNIRESTEETCHKYSIDLVIFHAGLDTFGNHMRIFFCCSTIINGIMSRHTREQNRYHLFLSFLTEKGNLHSVLFGIVRRYGIIAATL